MLKQIVSLRHDYGQGMQFSDEAGRLRYIAEFEQARELAGRLGRRFTVAPGQSVTTFDGRTLRPGDEVVVTRDFVHVTRRDQHGGSTFSSPPWAQLEALVFRGVVIEADIVQPGPEAA